MSFERLVRETKLLLLTGGFVLDLRSLVSAASGESVQDACDGSLDLVTQVKTFRQIPGLFLSRVVLRRSVYPFIRLKQEG
jgi:hypothetical protein